MGRPRLNLAAVLWGGILWGAITLLILSGCSLTGRGPAVQPLITPARQLASVQQLPSATAALAMGRPQPTASQTPPPSNTPGPTATPSPLPPLSGTGVRPDQALQIRAPESGPDSPVDWRPPPVPAPFALHPDDHYWLARPLASDTRNYDLEWYPYGNEPMLADALPYRIHHGEDFPNDTGKPIFAASSGTVIWAGPLPSARNGVNYYGNTVVIQHDWEWLGQEVYTLYAHTLELFVEVGDHVEQGELIAGVGASGEVSGPHIHLEVRVGENNYNSTRNPALWLAPYEGWGTLAGRFIDQRGEMIHGALVTVIPVNVQAEANVPIRRQRTYANYGVNPDDVWNENFVVADLPAGEYTLVLATAGELFRRSVQVRPGLTNFVVVQADFMFVPTPTPTPTLLPTPTGTPTPMGTPPA